MIKILAVAIDLAAGAGPLLRGVAAAP
jgi:hypothetical protein